MRGRREKPSWNWLGLVLVFIAVALIFAGLWMGVELLAKEFSVGLLSDIISVASPEDPADQVGDRERKEDEETVLESNLLVTENPYDLDAFMQTGEFITYTGQEPTTVGIDVSDHQLEIDWETVAGEGIDFAVVRVGYRGYTKGSLSLDDRYVENIEGALDNGMDVGVYFFSQAISVEEAIEEAALVLEAIEGYNIAYPVVFDWEEILVEARTDNMDPVLLTECAVAFCDTIEDAGYTAGVYFNQTYGYQHFNLSELSDYVLWLAQYDVVPDFRYNFHMWQYTATGTLAGIETAVDMNMSFWQP